MTLIVTFVDRNFVIQTSDRRVTYPAPRPPDDQFNKATLIGNHCTISFTGMAQMGPTAHDIRTDEWMYAALMRNVPGSLEEACLALQEEGSDAVAPIPLEPVEKRLAFVAAGWLSGQPGVPTVACITNALSKSGAWLPAPYGRFWIDHAELGHSPFRLHSFGQPVTPPLWRGLRARLRQILKNGGTSYVPIVDHITYYVQLEAARNPLIGSAMNIVMVPNPMEGPPRKVWALNGPPNPAAVTWASIPIRGTQYAPNTVGGKGGWIRGKAGYLDKNGAPVVA